MDKFAYIDQAAHAGANGHNNRPEATPGQQDAGNYAKGREVLHGLRIAIETPRGTRREWRAQDGTSGSNLMKFHYGYIEGTLGADGDELDVSIGPWPEAPRAFVVNQFMRGQFDEHKVMLGFPDRRTAEAGYLSNYEPGWKGMESCISCSIAQLQWWVANGNMKRPLTQDQLPYEGTDDKMDKVIWDSAHNPLHSTLDKVLYALRAHDADDGLLFDSVSMADILADSDGVLTFDALVIPYSRIETRMALLQKVLDRAGAAVKVAAMQVSEPFTQRGSTNVAVIYELSDGQTVSVFFHNPDVTPKKITSGDDLISWKWMLNKKDITVAVAPERGRDLDVRTVASRIMRLAEKNSARFIAANGKRAEKLQVITDLKGELETKKATLADLEQQIEIAIAAREAAGLDEVPDPVDPVVPEPEPEPVAVPALDVDGIRAVVTTGNPMPGVSIGVSWVVMNAPRPLMGTETTSNGEFLSGRFYAAIDPSDYMAQAYLDNNVKMDASAVFVADKATLTAMALNTINPEYLSSYMEMDEQTRERSISGFITKLNGKTYGELKELAAKGMPVADMWKRDVQQFAFNKPGFFGRALSFVGNTIINQQPPGTWTISKMGDGTYAAYFSIGDGKYTGSAPKETIEQAYEAMLSDPAYQAATAPAPTWRSKYIVIELADRFRVAGLNANPISPSYPTNAEAVAAAEAYMGGSEFPAPSDADKPAEPQSEVYRDYLIYPVNMKSGDGVVSRFAVQSVENRERAAAGERTIGGDSLHGTIEEARAEVDRMIVKAEADAKSKAEWDASEAERMAKEATARTEFEDVDGFTDGMNPMQKEKALQALNTTVSYRGNAVMRKALIRQKVADGFYIENDDGIPTLTDGDLMQTAKQLTKTGMDYAAFLIAKRPAPEVLPVAEVAPQPEPVVEPSATGADNADRDFIQSAIDGNADFYDKAVTDRLAELAKSSADGELADLIKQAKVAAKAFFIAEFTKKAA